MNNLLSRRSMLGSALAFSGVHLLGAGGQALAASPLPNSGFGFDSTAQEVTEGIDLSGKTALLTGSTGGIGLETLRTLVMRGAHVLALGRTEESAREACASVAGPSIQGRATPYGCDHTSFASVARCTEAIGRLGMPLDIVICNAGVYFLPQLELAERLEKQFVVNHLSHFLLVNRVMPQILASKEGRVVVVGSIAYEWAPSAGIEFDNLAGQKSYDPVKTYGQSKLANGLFALELARRFKGTRATANVVHPGWVMTQTMREYLAQKAPEAVDSKDAKTPQQGAATSCYVASSPALRRVSGHYFADCNSVEPRPIMRDGPLARKLWEMSEAYTRAYLRRA